MHGEAAKMEFLKQKINEEFGTYFDIVIGLFVLLTLTL